ncbi:MAG: glycoside hydrolase family 88 protein [Prevotellaceae bacterium]|jgi:chondroitin AC lyase|nr:glycoside hydrolase family 88 protein [Prevotellaceae bacterium]
MKKIPAKAPNVRSLLLLCTLCCCPAFLFAQASAVFTLKNSAAFNRVNEVVEVSVAPEVFGSLSSLALYDESNAVVPYQALPAEKKIIFQATVNASSTASYTLKAGTPTAAAAKTYGRQVAARYDDAAWENDLAAYRMYSKKLLASEPNTANGVDLWLKKQDSPIIDKMYTYADYHSEQPEGVDAYSVDGKTLGGGGVAAYANSKLWLHNPYDEYRLIASGPLRTEFLLTYNNVEVDGDFYTKTVRITTNANGLLNKAVVKYKGKVKAMKLAAGIYKHSAAKFGNANPQIFKSEPNLIGFAESKSEGTVTSPNARVFEGVYMPGVTTVSDDVSDHLVIMSDYVVGTEFTYYFGGGWNVFPTGRYATDNDWFNALRQLKEAAAKPLCKAFPTKAEVVNTAVGVNNAWIAKNTSPGNNLWARSVYNAGNIDFYKVYPEKSYLKYANLWATTNNWAVSGGPSTGDADNHTCGQTYIDLYRMDAVKDPKKIEAIKAAIDYRIANNPKSDDWWWIDAMLMAMPTLARLGTVYNDARYYDKMYALFSHLRDSLIVVPARANLWPVDYQTQYGRGPILSGYEAHCGLFNEADGLWWRDWGFQPSVPPKKDPYDSSVDVPKQSPNGKNVYWSRGNGWAIAAMTRTLQLLPATDAHRQEYISILTKMAAALKSRQRDDGFWNMNLDDERDEPGPETSGTALFAYGIAWGINAGLLDRDEYLPVVAKAWEGLATIAVQPNGDLKFTQNVGEKPIPVSQLASGSVDFGVGAFLLAASEVVKLASGDMPEIPAEPLELEAVSLKDATHLEVTFDRELDTLSAKTTASYSVNGVTAAAAELSGARTVTLTLGQALDYGRYTLFASNVKSADDNFVDPTAGKVFVYPVPLTPPAPQVTVTAIGNQSGNPPANTVDNDLSTRWAQAGFGQWIKYDLQREDSVWAVDIAFHLGNQRTAYFDVELSLDNATFTKVLSDGKSSGLTAEMERYTFPSQRARYVRIVCNSNSAGGENWNSVTEVRIPTLPPADAQSVEVEEVIMQSIREAEWEKVEDVSALNAEAEGLLSTLRANGSWADIPYDSREQTNWEPVNHLDRLKKLALAYTLSTSSCAGNSDLHAKISAALDYWHTSDPRSSNWYMQQIGCPQRVGVILILMRAGAVPLPDGLENKMTQRMKDIGGRPDQSGSQGTGANKIDIATHWIYRACLTKNAADLAFGAQQVYLPIELTTATEGLQHDLSIMQHGPQFYTGGYGSSFAGNVVNIAVCLRETPYAMSGEKLNLLTRFVRESYMRIIRGKYFLYNVLGRGLARPDALDQSSLAGLFGKTKFLDPSNAALYDSAVVRLKGTAHGGYGLERKHTHFFCADYTLYTSPEYTFDVRTVSTRTYRNENGNGENLKGYFLADGATAIAVDGDEYVDIFPVWEWTKIPGVTAPQKTSIPKPAEWGTFGTSGFAGGVTDSVYGASAYALNDQSNGVNTAAKKAWFFFGKEIVCLGAGIQSSAAEQISTTVNQCLLKGAVTVSLGGAETVAAAGGSYDYRSAGWIHHNKVGYIFPQGGTLKLETREQQGSWSAINTAYTGSVTKSVFKLWFDHAVKPSGGSYAYIVLPNVDASGVKSYSASDVEILANTDSVQAVRHKAQGMVQAIFYKAATLAASGFTLRTDKACAVMLKNVAAASVKVHVADPSQSASTLKLRFSSTALPDERELECALPQPPCKGASASFTIDIYTPGPAVTAEVVAFAAIEDAFVRGGYVNQGQNPIIEVKEDNGDDYRRHAYLKFSLSNIRPDSVEKVELALSIESAGTRIAYTEWLFSRVSDDSWTETGILWTNKPAPDSPPIDTVAGFAAGEVVVDVTELILQEIANGDSVLTIQIRSTKRDDGTTWVNFHSREASDAAKRPQLRVEKKVNAVAVSFSVSPGVTVIYPPVGSPCRVLYGGSLTLRFTVDSGYENPEVTAGGAPHPLDAPDAAGVYTATIPNLTSDIAIGITAAVVAVVPPPTPPATGIADVAANDPVVKTELYNMQGQEVREILLPGVYIVKKRHASGKVTVAKELRTPQR